MNQKRGQVTVFMVIGIVILVLISLWLLVFTGTQKEDIQTTPDRLVDRSISVSEYFQNCIDLSGKQALYTVAMQGGYNTMPNIYLETIFGASPFYYYNTVSFVPDIGLFTEEVSQNFFDRVKSDCSDFSLYEEMGYKITVGDLVPENTYVLRVGDIFNFIVEVPLEVIDYNDEKNTYERFTAKTETRFSELFGIAGRIIDEVENNPSQIPLSLLVDLEDEHDVRIMTFFYEEKVLYVIQEDRYILITEPTYLMFATNFDMDNLPPRFTETPLELVITARTHYSYLFKAEDLEDDMMTFSSSSSQFPVTDGGFLNVTPTTPGEYSIEVTVSDGELSNSINVLVRVEE